MVPIYIYGKF